MQSEGICQISYSALAAALTGSLLRATSRTVETEFHSWSSCKYALWEIVFPRVRTPCGHGAQVIIEGREIQSDGEEKDKDNPTTNKNKTNHSPQAETPPPSSISSVLG